MEKLPEHVAALLAMTGELVYDGRLLKAEDYAPAKGAKVAKAEAPAPADDKKDGE